MWGWGSEAGSVARIRCRRRPGGAARARSHARHGGGRLQDFGAWSWGWLTGWPVEARESFVRCCCSRASRSRRRLASTRGSRRLACVLFAGICESRRNRASAAVKMQVKESAPRTRGDGPGLLIDIIAAAICSPHARGWSPVGGQWGRRIRPAPRTRGDGPITGPSHKRPTCSLDPRGWSPCQAEDRGRCRLLPAAATMPAAASRLLRAQFGRAGAPQEVSPNEGLPPTARA